MTQQYILTWRILLLICEKPKSEWLKLNKQTLNTSKNKLMIFHRKQRHISELNIVINSTQIDPLQLFNFLGITLDDDLS